MWQSATGVCLATTHDDDYQSLACRSSVGRALISAQSNTSDATRHSGANIVVYDHFSTVEKRETHSECISQTTDKAIELLENLRLSSSFVCDWMGKAREKKW